MFINPYACAVLLYILCLSVAIPFIGWLFKVALPVWGSILGCIMISLCFWAHCVFLLSAADFLASWLLSFYVATCCHMMMFDSAIIANLRISPLFSLPGVFDVCLNLHWCSQIFQGGMHSFTGSACLCDGGSVFWAALHVVTACCSKALMCLRYGKTASFCWVTCSWSSDINPLKIFSWIVWSIVVGMFKAKWLIHIIAYLYLDQRLTQCS